MRPVNLIPPEERRDKAPIRTGPIAYLLVGALTMALGAVTLVVLTNNKISDREAKVTQLIRQEAQVKAQADQLAPFSNFASLEDQRTATVRSLANSRFDWERVMRELARIMPSDVWLTGLTGAVSGDTSVSGSGSSTNSGGGSLDTSSISGPSLHLSGCARGQDGVARFLSTLRDIDGVTRVGLGSSDLPDQTVSGSGGAGSNSSCAVRNFIAQFDIVVAFDAAPVPQIAAAAPSTSTPATSAGTPSASTPASDTSGAASGGS
jgi:Tfp pilus assembly protein PilN